MSSSVTTYVMIGDIFEYSKLKDRHDELEPYMDSAFEGVKHHKGLCVLFDGMCGEYVAIGRVLEKTANGEHFDRPFVFPSLSIDADERALLVAQISALAGQPAQFRQLVISHHR